MSLGLVLLIVCRVGLSSECRWNYTNPGPRYANVPASLSVSPGQISKNQFLHVDFTSTQELDSFRIGVLNGNMESIGTIYPPYPPQFMHLSQLQVQDCWAVNTKLQNRYLWFQWADPEYTGIVKVVGEVVQGNTTYSLPTVYAYINYDPIRKVLASLSYQLN
ncbi:uncharacterized protein LOC111716217 [Eurytemora carolleeae]|uniref:uncharacterized protein LOC111716217 n=1 Tax=Eurytemora carolleeae TaxID=1294199 RepID=UPI000C774270|nr:uncharacterized protein LOC111716217 [Eurytemora carolleeae]|eukprot:XP_023347426.1 uncharacterized protein LOC111716217 [Eurytemora affinis]